jgi:anti-anti-sigma factor
MDARRHGETVVTDLPGDRWLVTLAGDHDLSTADDLREKLRTIFQTGATVVLDLSDTTFIDSSTLAVLMDADAFAQEHGCDRFGIVIARESAPDRLFQLAGVHRVFTTFDSVDEAFAHFESATDAGTAERWRQRKQRIAKNEQAFRDYNDRRLAHESVDATDDEEPIPFICECGDKDCFQALVITAAEFTEAHSAPNRFIVKSGHVYQDVERIIAEKATFAVVEKHIGAFKQAT